MKKRPTPPDPMIFKRHEPRKKCVTVFNKDGRRMMRHGSKDRGANRPLFDIKDN